MRISLSSVTTEYQSFVCVNATGFIPSGNNKLLGKFRSSERILMTRRVTIIKIPTIIDAVSIVTKRCKNLKFLGN